MDAPEIRTHILKYLKKHGETHSRDIYKSLPPEKKRAGRRQLATLKQNGEVVSRNRFYYSLTTETPQIRLDKQLNEIAEALRSPDANKNTIDRLMNLYDVVVGNYETWIAKNLNSKVDFEKQLLFIENFKWLTSIGDKLMKRWSLEHKGYDTNTRQAQEDAKAQTAAREKAALENAPVSDRVMIIGKYDPEAEELIDCIPSSLESMTSKEEEEVKV